MRIRATSMTAAERMCTVVFDEMAIKRHFDYDAKNDGIYGASPTGEAAKQAMVVMVRGILGKWKQVRRLEKELSITLPRNQN